MCRSGRLLSRSMRRTFFSRRRETVDANFLDMVDVPSLDRDPTKRTERCSMSGRAEVIVWYRVIISSSMSGAWPLCRRLGTVTRRGRLNLLTAFWGVVMPRGRYSAAKARPKLKAMLKNAPMPKVFCLFDSTGSHRYGRLLEDADVGHLSSVQVFRYAGLFPFLQVGLIIALVGRCLSLKIPKLACSGRRAAGVFRAASCVSLLEPATFASNRLQLGLYFGHLRSPYLFLVLRQLLPDHLHLLPLVYHRPVVVIVPRGQFLLFLLESIQIGPQLLQQPRR